MTEARLSVEGLSVEFSVDGEWRSAVREASFSLTAGQVLALVGESGSGKTATAMSLLGLLPSNARVSGRALLDGTSLLDLDPAARRAARGGRVGMVFQEPMSALNPVFTVGNQLVEAIRAHQEVPAAQARTRAAEVLGLVGLPDPDRLLRAYPHELSGGQAQRVVIAMAVANEPALLIADEPTTALDVTVQAEILELLRDLRDRLGVAILLITHDMGVVADIADHVVVLHDGGVVEQGEVTRVFTAASADYTKRLLGSVVSLESSPASYPDPVSDSGDEVVVRGDHVVVTAHPARRSVPDSPLETPAVLLEDVSVVYGGRFRSLAVRAVHGANLHVRPGEVVGLVGESGSGKSTVAGVITGLVPLTTGRVEVAGRDIAALGRREQRRARGRIGVVFQDPVSSLNPRATIGDSIAEPLRLHGHRRGAELDRRVAELLGAVQLVPDMRTRYPHELSGGQRQRVGIARAIALDPDLLIADEPTSALDVSVQAKILDLFRALQRDLGFACLFISHDLAVVQQLADRVAVMHRGHLVEQGPTKAVLTEPRHPYTQRLLASAPVADPEEQRRRRAARV